MGRKVFQAKMGGVLVGACFTCHKFGHLALQCPTLLHQPPPTAIPQDPLQPRKQGANIMQKKMDNNSTTMMHTGTQDNIVAMNNDKGKAKVIAHDPEQW